MKIYTIYVDSKGSHQAVKQGWSWPAFVFTWGWAMVKGVWKLSTLSTIILAGSFILMMMSENLVPQVNVTLIADLLAVYMGYLVLALSFIMGAKGNQWVTDKLSKQGYQYKEIVIADNPAAAITLYQEDRRKKFIMTA